MYLKSDLGDVTFKDRVLVSLLCLGGGFKYFLCSPLLGEDSHFDEYFSKGLKPPTRYLYPLSSPKQNERFRPNHRILRFFCFFFLKVSWEVPEKRTSLRAPSGSSYPKSGNPT